MSTGLERLTPLQRTVLHVLCDGRWREAHQVSYEVERLTPPLLDARAVTRLRLAICGALERLVALGLAEHRGRTGYVLEPGLTAARSSRPTPRPSTTPPTANAAATRNAVS